MTTLAPFSASWQATALPMPSEPPVITAVYEAKFVSKAWKLR